VTSAGAGCPIWKSAPVDADGSGLAPRLAPGSELTLADGATEGSGPALEALGVAAATGAVVMGGGLSGARATIAPSRRTAATIPTTSPVTIDRRPITAGAYQYERPTAAFGNR